MHVQLKLRLACPVDVATDALRDPQVMVAVTKPLVVYRSESPSGFPDRWTEEAHPVSASIFGVLPLGSTHVDLDWHERDGAWIQRDTGRGTSGQFARMRINHRMAVVPDGPGHTLLRDRLEFHAGPLGPLLWPGLWATWQWRALRMKSSAPSWRGASTHPKHA